MSKEVFVYKIVFLPSYGFCKEFSNYNPLIQQVIIFMSEFNETGYEIFITDSTYRSYFSVDFASHKEDKIMLNINEHHFMNVETKKKSGCLTEENEISPESFNQCVQDGMESKLMTPLGCIPPWLSSRHQCNGTHNRPFFNNIPQFPYEYIQSLMTFENTRIEESCKKCLTTNFIVKSRAVKPYTSFSSMPSPRALITFNPKVSVNEKVLNYSIFQFIIDVGSSLGLWLGLSVLGRDNEKNTITNALIFLIFNRKICTYLIFDYFTFLNSFFP